MSASRTSAVAADVSDDSVQLDYVLVVNSLSSDGTPELHIKVDASPLEGVEGSQRDHLRWLTRHFLDEGTTVNPELPLTDWLEHQRDTRKTDKTARIAG